jgi:hypothetical protein
MTKFQFVEDLSGFNFIENPFRKETHIFESFQGHFICNSPKATERFKHQLVLRKATKEEKALHIQKTTPECVMCGKRTKTPCSMETEWCSNVL